MCYIPDKEITIHIDERSSYTVAAHISRLLFDDYRYMHCIEGVRSVAYLIVFNK